MDGIERLKEWDGIAHARWLDDYEAGRQASEPEKQAKLERVEALIDELIDDTEQARRLIEFAASKEYERRRRIVDEFVLREALVNGLREKGMTVAEAARRIGLPHATPIYNFIAQRSQSMTYWTSFRLAELLGFDLIACSRDEAPPGSEELATIEARVDELGAPDDLRQLVERLKRVVSAQAIRPAPMPLAAIAAEMLMVKVNIDDEGPRASMTLPQSMQEPLTGRMSSYDAGRRTFGARIIGNVAAPVYKPGTVLICVPTSFSQPATPLHGRRVLACVRSARSSPQWKSFTVEVREVSLDPETLQRRLLPLNADTSSVPLDMPEEVFLAPWRTQGFDVKVAAVVIGSIVSEEGPRR